MAALVFLMPFFWMLSSSLKTSLQVFDYPFRWITDTIQWSNYVEVWFYKEIPFYMLYMNSLIISCTSVVGQLLLSSLAAYAFAKIDFKGKIVLFIILLVSMMIPIQAMIIPRYVLFRAMRIYNTLWSIILPNLFSITSIFLLRQFYMILPNELIEASRMDGANHFTIWARVMMPLTKNAMISAAILAFINSWNEYLTPLIFLAKKGLYTVPLGIKWYIEDIAKEYNLMMAAAASGIIPIIIFYMLAQNYFEEGIATVGVKG